MDNHEHRGHFFSNDVTLLIILLIFVLLTLDGGLYRGPVDLTAV